MCWCILEMGVVAIAAGLSVLAREILRSKSLLSMPWSYPHVNIFDTFTNSSGNLIEMHLIMLQIRRLAEPATSSDLALLGNVSAFLSRIWNIDLTCVRIRVVECKSYHWHKMYWVYKRAAQMQTVTLDCSRGFACLQHHCSRWAHMTRRYLLCILTWAVFSVVFHDGLCDPWHGTWWGLEIPFQESCSWLPD